MRLCGTSSRGPAEAIPPPDAVEAAAAPAVTHMAPVPGGRADDDGSVAAAEEFADRWTRERDRRVRVDWLASMILEARGIVRPRADAAMTKLAESDRLATEEAALDARVQAIVPRAAELARTSGEAEKAVQAAVETADPDELARLHAEHQAATKVLATVIKRYEELVAERHAAHEASTALGDVDALRAEAERLTSLSRDGGLAELLVEVPQLASIPEPVPPSVATWRIIGLLAGENRQLWLRTPEGVNETRREYLDNLAMLSAAATSGRGAAGAPPMDREERLFRTFGTIPTLLGTGGAMAAPYHDNTGRRPS
jgi:hypothetical protein